MGKWIEGQNVSGFAAVAEYQMLSAILSTTRYPMSRAAACFALLSPFYHFLLLGNGKWGSDMKPERTCRATRQPPPVEIASCTRRTGKISGLFSFTIIVVAATRFKVK